VDTTKLAESKIAYKNKRSILVPLIPRALLELDGPVMLGIESDGDGHSTLGSGYVCVDDLWIKLQQPDDSETFLSRWSLLARGVPVRFANCESNESSESFLTHGRPYR
jgi:hypothetical protein